MATEVGNIFYSLDLDDKKFKEGMNSADSQAKGFSGRLDAAKGASFGLMAGLTAIAAGAVAFGVSSVKAANESNTALAQLDAVLKSTGGAAGVTKKQITDLSTAIEHQTGISDEAVTGAQSMLLTFTSIGKDVFPKATQTVVDMATAMNGGAIPSAEALRNESILLGKALQDPDKGLGALHRVGVNTDELAKKFTASMSIQEKQKLILGELNTEFGGSAKAAGETFAGAMAKLTEIFGDFQENVGNAIEKALVPFINTLSGFVGWLADQDPMKLLADGFKAIQPYIPIIAGAIMGGLVPALVAMVAAFAAFWAPLIPFMIAGAAIAAVVEYLVGKLGGWKAVMADLNPYIQDAQTLLRMLYDTVTGGDPTLKKGEEKFAGISKVLSEVGYYLGIAETAVGNFVKNLDVKGILIAIKDAIKDIWDHIVGFYNFMTTNAFVLLAWNTTLSILKDIVSGLWSIFTTFVAFVISSLIPGIQQFIQTIQTSGIVTTVIAIIAGAVGLLVEAFRILWPAVVSLVNTIMTQLMPALINLWNAIAPVLLPVLNVLLIVLGVAAGIIGVVVVAALWLLINAIRIVIIVFSSIIQVVAFVVGVIAAIIGGIINIVTLPFRIALDIVKGIFSGASFSQIFGNVIGTISNVLGGVWAAITNPFRNAFNWVRDTVTDLAKHLADKLNPFQRHSPSLYDLVSGGTKAMGGAYMDFFDGVQKASNRFDPNVAPGAVSAMALGGTASGSAAASASTGDTYHIDLKGVLADSPQAKRDLGLQLVEAVNEVQRAKNKPQLGVA